MSPSRLFWDVTRLGGTGPETGIRRLSRHLRGEIAQFTGRPPIEVRWSPHARAFMDDAGASPGAADALVTPELFSEAERPGIGAWLLRRPCRVLGFCHDLLPLRMPESVRPNAVRRAADHLRLLALCDKVLAISRDTAEDLRRWWEFQRPPHRPPIAVIRPGADGTGVARNCAADPVRSRYGLMIGSIEPRKRQAWIAGCAARIATLPEGSRLVVAGRVNEHNGGAELRRILDAGRRSEVRIQFSNTPSAGALRELLAGARFLVFASAGEGAGLPVGESLWAGVPCLMSDLPVHAEWGSEGCVRVPADDADRWAEALSRAWSDDAWIAGLAEAARSRSLPTWQTAARSLIEELS